MRKITNELDILPTNSQIMVERVPISFAEVTYYSQPQQKLDYKAMKGGTKKQMAAQHILVKEISQAPEGFSREQNEQTQQ